VDHLGDVRLVDSHPEGIGGDNRLEGTRHELFLVVPAFRRAKPEWFIATGKLSAFNSAWTASTCVMLAAYMIPTPSSSRFAQQAAAALLLRSPSVAPRVAGWPEDAGVDDFEVAKAERLDNILDDLRCCRNSQRKDGEPVELCNDLSQIGKCWTKVVAP
jgi:hypothetical protein